MKTMLTLIKTALNVNFGISALRYRFVKEKKKRWEPIVSGIAIIYGVGVITALYSLALYGFLQAGKTMQHPEIVLTVAFMIAQVLVFFFGIFYLMSSFYFSKDINILVPMPLKPSQIIGSKFITVMVNEYITILPFLLPALILYGAGTQQNLFYWMKGIILLLTAPVIPLALGTCFVLLLMRVVNVRKSKDLLLIVGSMLGITVGLGINFLSQKVFSNAQNTTDMTNILAGKTGLVEMIGQKFPPSLWATYGLSNNNWQGFGYFILFVGVAIALFILMMIISKLVFYKGLLSGQETTRKRKILSSSEMMHQTSKISRPIMALFYKEWKLFVRTPLYVINGFAGMFILPIILFMPTMTQDPKINFIFSLAKDAAHTLPLTLGVLAGVLFTANMNMVSATSMSREGSTFWISKSIPITPHDQVLSKVIHGMSISLLGVLIESPILGVLFGLSIPRIIIIILLGTAISLLMNVLNLFIDVMHPKLEWSSPQEAFKQNINAFFGILITLAIIGLLAALSVPLILLGIPEWLLYLLLAFVVVLACIPSFGILYAIAERKYHSLEI